MRLFRYILLLILLPLLAGCKADFSPNAEWKEVPAAYCLLDQDDSVSYVRVQKCYLGDGNLKDYSRIADSSNYPNGEISVQILAWKNEEEMRRTDATPRRTLDFDYHLLTDKAEGVFAAPEQPIYCHSNQQGDLDTALLYQLVVRRQATGEVLLRATTRLVGDASREAWLAMPSGQRRFAFRGSYGGQISWYPFVRARRYQVELTFLYRCRYQQPDSTRGVRMTLSPVVASGGVETYGISLSQTTYLANIRNALQGDTTAKVFVDSVRIALAMCDETLHAYMNTTDMLMAYSDQDVQPYTNIEGGIGLFAARRTHMRQTVPSDNSDNPNGLHTRLEELGVGFEKQ